GVLLVGDVHASPRLADPVEFLEDQLRPVEDEERMPAGDEVELVILEQHRSGIAEGEFDIANAEFLRHLPRIAEARPRMIERHQARRLELLVEEHRKIADAAADIRNLEAGFEAVARKYVALVPPCDPGLIAQDGNEARILGHQLAGIEVLVIDL